MKATRKRTKKNATLKVGIYSEGTLRPADLALALANELACVRLSRKDRGRVTSLGTLAGAYSDYNDEGVRDSSRAYDELYAMAYDYLCELAGNYLPAYTYFGSSEGDGACIGVWPYVEGAREDCLSGDLPVVNDGIAPGEYCGLALEINDHGNVTLWNVLRGGRMVEIWGVV